MLGDGPAARLVEQSKNARRLRTVIAIRDLRRSISPPDLPTADPDLGGNRRRV
jgi:hypothetical protein